MNRRGFLAGLAGLIVGPPAAAAAPRVRKPGTGSLFNPVEPIHYPGLAPAIRTRTRQLSVLILNEQDGEIHERHLVMAHHSLQSQIAIEGKRFGPGVLYHEALPLPFGVEGHIEHIGEPIQFIPVRYLRQHLRGDEHTPECWVHRWDVLLRFEPWRERAKIGETITVKKPARYNRIVSNAEVSQYMLSTFQRELGRG
jgi:hypothetical protein